MEPKEKEMQSLQEHVRDLDQQLQQASRMTLDLDNTILEMKMKLKAQDRELGCLKSELGKKTTSLSRIQFDLGQCARFVDSPKELKVRSFDAIAQSRIFTGPD